MAETLLLFQIGDAAEEAGDYASAKRAFERGAALGDHHCWSRLGYLYDIGRGVATDKRQAMRCYLRAWRQEDLCAANNIAILYRERGNYPAMFRWFERAAKKGDGSAHLELAKCYRDGVGVRKSPEAAMRCLAVALSSQFISEEERDEAAAMIAARRPRLASS